MLPKTKFVYYIDLMLLLLWKRNLPDTKSNVLGKKYIMNRNFLANPTQPRWATHTYIFKVLKWQKSALPRTYLYSIYLFTFCIAKTKLETDSTWNVWASCGWIPGGNHGRLFQLFVCGPNVIGNNLLVEEQINTLLGTLGWWKMRCLLFQVRARRRRRRRWRLKRPLEEGKHTLRNKHPVNCLKCGRMGSLVCNVILWFTVICIQQLNGLCCPQRRIQSLCWNYRK